MINLFDKITVIAPHPDDETLGVGGTIARFVDEGKKVSVLFVSGHLPPIYKEKDFEKVQLEAVNAMKQLGVEKYEFLKIPATTLSNHSVADLNNRIKSFIDEMEPNVVFLPFPDRHIDHRVIFDASVVACRPVKQNAPKVVLAYETLSETHWNVPGIEPVFAPEFFIDISNYIENKTKALDCYISQIKDNSSRSIDATKALAKFRGSQNGCFYAEAFKVVRIVF